MTFSHTPRPLRLKTALLLQALLLLAPVGRSVALAEGMPGASPLAPSTPVEHFSIYNFDEQSGWRTWKLEGSRAKVDSKGVVTMENVHFRVFRPGEEQDVTLLIESPLAAMAPGKDSVSGPTEIFTTGDGFLLSGEDWTWNTSERRLTIRSHAHAVIDISLGPILE